MQMRTLYPKIEPNKTGMLPVSEIHTLYWEECGNPNGKPILFIHGGPGGGTSPSDRCFFDPEHYRIILFDQRGCGKSTPYASLQENTTWHLVDDIEKLRTHLGIEKWILFGGSWGSTLALTYAESFPERVEGLILRGIFLCRPDEIAWFYQEGASFINPAHWEEYLSPIPLEDRHQMIEAYYKQLTCDDQEVRSKAEKGWIGWEGANMKLLFDQELYNEFISYPAAECHARIECHYFYHNAFFATDNWLIENIDKIRHCRGTIIHGQYDLVCPMKAAWALHKAWPEAKFITVADAGHASSEVGTTDQLVRATDAYRDL